MHWRRSLLEWQDHLTIPAVERIDCCGHRRRSSSTHTAWRQRRWRCVSKFHRHSSSPADSCRWMIMRETTYLPSTPSPLHAAPSRARITERLDHAGLGFFVRPGVCQGPSSLQQMLSSESRRSSIVVDCSSSAPTTQHHTCIYKSQDLQRGEKAGDVH